MLNTLIITHTYIEGNIMQTPHSEEYFKNIINLLLSQQNKLRGGRDPESILTLTLELLSDYLNLKKGRVFLWDSQQEKLVIRYSTGLTQQQINVGKYDISEGITGEVLSDGHAVLVPNVKSEPHFKGKIAALSPQYFQPSAYIAVPISYGNFDLGVLAVECDSQNDGDIEANAIVLKMVAEMFAKMIYQYGLNEFTDYQVAS